MPLPRRLSRLADADGRIDVRALSRADLVLLLDHLGDDSPDGRALRLYKHLWQKGSQSFDDVLTVSKRTRQLLNDQPNTAVLLAEVTGVDLEEKA